MTEKKDKKPVQPVEWKNGEPHLNPGADGANVDWLRAARLKRQGKEKELKEKFDTPVYDIDEDDFETEDE